MDVRLFKLLVFIAGEVLLAILSVALRKFLPVTHFNVAALQGVRNLQFMVPIFLLLPESNWIWLVEENIRTRKISLRSKASKHLYLSMLYWLMLGLPFFVVTMSYLMEQPTFGAPLTYAYIPGALVVGLYCAWKNSVNVLRYSSLFAVAWDRRSSFVELFIGINVSRKMKFFYPPWILMLMAIFLVSSAMVVPAYYTFAGSPEVDREKFIVLAVLFNFFLTFSVMTTSMYLFFQVFFLPKVDRWARDRSEREGYNT
jgi:hypothetical protein